MGVYIYLYTSCIASTKWHKFCFYLQRCSFQWQTFVCTHKSLGEVKSLRLLWQQLERLPNKPLPDWPKSNILFVDWLVWCSRVRNSARWARLIVGASRRSAGAVCFLLLWKQCCQSCQWAPRTAQKERCPNVCKRAEEIIFILANYPLLLWISVPGKLRQGTIASQGLTVVKSNNNSVLQWGRPPTVSLFPLRESTSV